MSMFYKLDLIFSSLSSYLMLRTNPHSLRSCLCFRVFRLNFHTTDQMAEWYSASASGSVDLGFNSESGQTNDFKIGIHSFLLDAQQ